MYWVCKTRLKQLDDYIASESSTRTEFISNPGKWRAKWSARFDRSITANWIEFRSDKKKTRTTNFAIESFQFACNICNISGLIVSAILFFAIDVKQLIKSFPRVYRLQCHSVLVNFPIYTHTYVQHLFWYTVNCSTRGFRSAILRYTWDARVRMQSVTTAPKYLA